jgi:hypothetical protein
MATHILSGRLTVEQTNISLIQAPWAFRERIKSSDGSLFYCSSAKRSWICAIQVRSYTPPLCSMDVVALLVTCKVYAENRMVVVIYMLNL